MILTLIDGRTNEEICDVDIPEGLTALDFMAQWDKEQASTGELQNTGHLLEGKEPGGAWFPVPGDMLLADSGLQEGSFIRVKNIYSTVSVSVQEESSVPLFRDRDE